MNWWNANRRDVPRTVVMYLSGQRGVKDVVSGWGGGAAVVQRRWCSCRAAQTTCTAQASTCR